MIKGSYLSTTGYCIPKENVTKDQINTIKKELTMIPIISDYNTAEIETTKYKIYTIEDDVIKIPKYYGINTFGLPKKIIYEPKQVCINFTGTLRKYQEHIVETCMKHIKKCGGGLLVVPCGAGKTTMSINIASQLGLKTLIITHKTFLQDQWIARCKQFTNSEIGIIRQNKIETENKDFVIAMIQSLSKRDYDLEIFKDFGLVIADECFHGNELVMANDGNIKISQLCEMFKNNQQLPLIKSYNLEKGLYEFKKMTYAWEKESTDIVEVRLNNGNTIVCTSNHKFLTIYGYVSAKNLKNKLIYGDNYSFLYVDDIISIPMHTNIYVYDIEVEDNHNFIIWSNKQNESGVIVHNCHHFSSKHFSKALAKTGAKYTIGLSATPYRNDGLIKIVNWYLGDIMFNKRLQTNNQVISKNLTFLSNDDLFKEKKRFINGSVKPDCVKMISNLIKLECRNNHIVKIIDELRKNPDRKILILSERKSHLKYLKEKIDDLIKKDIDEKKILQEECRTYFYTGDVKQNDRLEAEQYADILFATFSMAHEGLDIDRLNTIILATPKKDVVQAVGRILRKILQNGDIRPLIIDIVDNLSIFKLQAKKREQFYKKSKYIQHYYYLSNDNIISPYDFSKLIRNEDENLNNDMPKNYLELLDVPMVDITDINEENSNNTVNVEKKYKDSCNVDVCLFRKR